VNTKYPYQFERQIQAAAESYLHIMFMVSICFVTSLYVLYYKHLVNQVQNVQVYIQYWRSYRVGRVYPVLYVCALSISYAMVHIYVLNIEAVIRHMGFMNHYFYFHINYLVHFILGELSIITYVLLLPKFLDVHREILDVMNDGAEY
jgi:hypothetical protein